MRIIYLFILVLLFAIGASAQTTAPSICPVNMICISQEAANRARDNALENNALKEKIAVLEDALKAKTASVEELRKLNDTNTADLKARLSTLEIELARVNGMLTARESEVVRQTAIITTMIPMLRKKRIGLINLF